MADSNSFSSPYEILAIAPENRNDVCKEIFLFYHEIVCYVFSLALPLHGSSNEYTQHTIIEDLRLL